MPIKSVLRGIYQTLNYDNQKHGYNICNLLFKTFVLINLDSSSDFKLFLYLTSLI